MAYCAVMVVIEAKGEKKIRSKFIVFEPINPSEKIKQSTITVVTIFDLMLNMCCKQMVKQNPYRAIWMD